MCLSCVRQGVRLLRHGVMHTGTSSSMPNSPTAGAPSAEALQYKATAVAAMREYLSSSDAAEVASTLQELHQPHLAHIFVKQVSHCHVTVKDFHLGTQHTLQTPFST